jgi:hypothetical protein
MLMAMAETVLFAVHHKNLLWSTLLMRSRGKSLASQAVAMVTMTTLQYGGMTETVLAVQYARTHRERWVVENELLINK